MTKSIVGPLVKPLNSCCIYVLNDCEWESNCSCQNCPCTCHLRTHEIDVEEEERRNVATY